ncbi:hypothetical protein ACOSQ2_013326 [Xanthoceras sorbifolium]
MDQMNENSERLRAVEAENKDLKNKLYTMVTTATPLPRFSHLTNRRPSRALRASDYWYNIRRDESAGFTKYGSRRPSDHTNSQYAFHT